MLDGNVFVYVRMTTLDFRGWPATPNSLNMGAGYKVRALGHSISVNLKTEFNHVSNQPI